MGCSVSSVQRGSGGVVLEVKTDGHQNKLNRNVNQRFPVGVSSVTCGCCVFEYFTCTDRRQNTVMFKDW